MYIINGSNYYVIIIAQTPDSPTAVSPYKNGKGNIVELLKYTQY